MSEIQTLTRPHARDGTATRVMLVLADGVSLTTVSSTLEPFQQANSCLNRVQFDIQLVSLGSTDPTTRAGIPIPCQATAGDVLGHYSSVDGPDLAILCCGLTMDPREQDLLRAFTRKLVRAGIPFFALGAACETLAAAGMIEGKKCAAHWKSLAPLGERFPDLTFENVLYASNGRITSCAGELASFDLIVDFIERVCGSGIGGEVCNHFLACGKRSGETVQFLSSDALICEDERFHRALGIMMENIETPVSVAEIARRMGLSVRQIERIFAANGFQSPLRYYARLRLNRARQLLEQTRMSRTEIALACGFENQSVFSKVYRREFGVSPNGSRNRCGPVQGAASAVSGTK